MFGQQKALVFRRGLLLVKNGKCLGFPDVRGFGTFFGGDYVKLHRVVLRKAFEAISLNSGEMYEDIRGTIFRRNEAEAFCIVEPLYFSFCSHLGVYLYCSENPRYFGGPPRGQGT